MSTKKPKQPTNKKTKGDNQEEVVQFHFEGMNADQIKATLVEELGKKAEETNNVLTYSVIANMLESYDLDKNLIDEVYDELLSKGVELVTD